MAVRYPPLIERARTFILEAMRIAGIAGITGVIRTRRHDDDPGGPVWSITVFIREPDPTSARDAKREAARRRG